MMGDFCNHKEIKLRMFFSFQSGVRICSHEFECILFTRGVAPPRQSRHHEVRLAIHTARAAACRLSPQQRSLMASSGNVQTRRRW